VLHGFVQTLDASAGAESVTSAAPPSGPGNTCASPPSAGTKSSVELDCPHAMNTGKRPTHAWIAIAKRTRSWCIAVSLTDGSQVPSKKDRGYLRPLSRARATPAGLRESIRGVANYSVGRMFTSSAAANSKFLDGPRIPGGSTAGTSRPEHGASAIRESAALKGKGLRAG
jgi:hypothetical protein